MARQFFALVIATCALVQTTLLAQGEKPKFTEAELKEIQQRHTKAAAKLQQLYGRPVAHLKVGDDGVYVCHVGFRRGDNMNPGLPLLKDLFNVKTIYAAAARFEDDGENIEVLGELKELEDLQIYFTSFGDKTAKVISELPKLKHLSVSTTAITDEGIRELAKLPNLEYLSIASTGVTDNSLPVLAEMKKLKGLSMEMTRMSPEGVQRFNAAHPDVTSKAYWAFNASTVGGGVRVGN